MKAQDLLAGVRVVDLSQYIPGPFATRQLADLGADVIKVEPPGGDPMRFFMHRDNDESSPIYRHLNRGKRICKLDLKTDDGRDCLTGLLGEADILLESFRPGVLERLGFERQRLDRINPRLIHCAISGYGQNGPYRLRAGHDINYCAGSSQINLNGTAQQPVTTYPPLADHAAALQASTAMLAALHARDRRAGSTYLDISLLETCLSWQYLPLLAASGGREGDLLNGGSACYNLYRCADGLYFSLGAIETVFWENFCRALDQPQWIKRQFEAMPQLELIAEVAGVVARQPRDYWNELLNPVDCCYEALYTADELAEHPQMQARQSLAGNGPGYPGWIDQQAVLVSDQLQEINDADDIRWLSGT